MPRKVFLDCPVGLIANDWSSEVVSQESHVLWGVILYESKSSSPEFLNSICDCRLDVRVQVIIKVRLRYTYSKILGF